MKPSTRTARHPMERTPAILVAALCGLLVACSTYDDDTGPGHTGPGTGPNGSYEYVSAYGGGQSSSNNGYPDAGTWDTSPGVNYDAGTSSQDAMATEDASTSDSGTSSGSEVVRGDIFRLMGEDHLLNLNSYRGLQVIDFSDLEHPVVVGRLPLDGSAIEMHLVGQYAYILMSPQITYYPSGIGVQAPDTGEYRVLSVDLTTLTKPRPLEEQSVPGSIVTSRVVTDGEHAALYVVTSHWASSGGGQSGSYDAGYDSIYGETRTVVTSFDITGGALDPVTELDLGGYVSAVQATSEVLMVARTPSVYSGSYGDRVALVDISDPRGQMVERSDVQVAGRVTNLFAMDMFEGMLRVVSTDWSNNTVETFDASDLDAIEPLDQATFGSGQTLYATLFLGNKAFFVTFQRVDPFHAFEISDAGELTERTEFIVSGWNDFFAPVFGSDRLIGIGVNDQNWGNTMAVSLYDSADLTNSEPLIVRAEVEALWSSSEASWDDRAFTVIEGAVEVESANGDNETGMVLLPFSGWSADGSEYLSAVQIFTFSPDSLTRRGTMSEQGNPVRRSFVVEEDTTANLSDSGLSLFDHGNPDEPVQIGHLELAPNFTELFAIGDHIARIQSFMGDNGWWGVRDVEDRQPSHIDVIPASQDVDLSQGVATVETPAQARHIQVGDLIVSVETLPSGNESSFVVHDFSDPLNPTEMGRLTATGRFDGAMGYDTGYWSGWSNSLYEPVQVLENAVVFISQSLVSRFDHEEEVCYTYPEEDYDCWSSEYCSWYQGSITCRSIDGAGAVCDGTIQRCQYEDYCDYGYCVTCQDVTDLHGIDTATYCETYTVYDEWLRFHFDILDLVEPEAPRMVTLDTGEEERAASAVASGQDLFYSYAQPVTFADDSRPYAAFFMKRVDLSDPSEPLVSRANNVPGEVVAVQGENLFTRDFQYGSDGGLVTAIARLRLDGDTVSLDVRRTLPDRQIRALELDDRGLMLLTLASDDGCWDYYGWGCAQDSLAVIDMDSDDLDTIAELPLQTWGSFIGAQAQRAFFTTLGGLIVVNLEDARAPFLQAFHPVMSSFEPSLVVSGDDLMVADGRWGVRRFSLDETNLSQ